MNTKHFKFVVLTLILVAAMVAPSFAVNAQGDVKREDTVIFDIDSDSIADPYNFNYFVPGTARNQGMHQAVWEPLFILNYETGEIQPWLGVSFEPNETLDVWTLKLREGIKWQDGEDFNADDVIWTINFLKDPDNITFNEAAGMNQWVESVEKVDDLTVRFNLTAPNPRFQLDYFSVRIWGSVLIMPEHVFSQVDDVATFTFYDPEKGWPFGTGPYKLVSASETEFIYDRDDNWWGAQTGWMDLPEPLRLEFIITGPEEQKALLMSNHELDSAMDITLGAFEAIQARNPNVIAWYDELPYAWFDPCPRQLSLNHTVSPWDNPEMRKAVSLIVDRNQIIEIAYEGTSKPSKTIFVEYGGMMPYINAIGDAGLWVAPEGNVEAGQALIEANGWTMNGDGFYEKDGKVLSLDIQTHEAFIEKRRIANVIVEQLRAAGIDTTTRAVAGGTFTDNIAFGNFEGVIDWEACHSVNEPWGSMNRYNVRWYREVGERSPSNHNFVRWNTEGAQRYSEIVDAMGVLPLGDPQIVDMVVEAYQIFMDEQVVIPISQARKLVPFDTTYWVGWPTAKNNYNHPATWWNSTHQIIHNLHKAE